MAVDEYAEKLLEAIYEQRKQHKLLQPLPDPELQSIRSAPQSYGKRMPGPPDFEKDRPKYSRKDSFGKLLQVIRRVIAAFVKTCEENQRENFFVMFALDEWPHLKKDEMPTAIANIEETLQSLRDLQDSVYTYHVIHVKEEGKARVASEPIGYRQQRSDKWGLCNNEVYFNLVDKVHGEKLRTAAFNDELIGIVTHHRSGVFAHSTTKTGVVMLSCRCYSFENQCISFCYSYPPFTMAKEVSQVYGCPLNSWRDAEQLKFVFESVDVVNK
jgi:hypothetical protein